MKQSIVGIFAVLLSSIMRLALILSVLLDSHMSMELETISSASSRRISDDITTFMPTSPSSPLNIHRSFVSLKSTTKLPKTNTTSALLTLPDEVRPDEMLDDDGGDGDGDGDAGEVAFDVFGRGNGDGDGHGDGDGDGDGDPKSMLDVGGGADEERFYRLTWSRRDFPEGFDYSVIAEGRGSQHHRQRYQRMAFMYLLDISHLEYHWRLTPHQYPHDEAYHHLLSNLYEKLYKLCRIIWSPSPSPSPFPSLPSLPSPPSPSSYIHHSEMVRVCYN